MVFVTVGSQKFQFDRLIKAVDALCADGIIESGCFAQTGACAYEPQHMEHKDFLDREEFRARMDACDTVITHGGTGAIIGAVKDGKKVIAVPRHARYGEHVDDHQEQIAAKFEEMGYVRVCREIGELGSCYAGMEDFPCRRLEPDFSKTAKLINGYLDDIEDKERKPWPKK